ncbi:MAG: potassium channel family protein [Dissulfurispiraceae bacterium]
MFRNFRRFWSKENSLSALLVGLIVKLFVLLPMTGGGEIVGLIVDLVFSLILIAGLNSMARHKAVRVFFSVFVVLGFVSRYTSILFDLHFLAGFNAVFSDLALIGILVVTLQMVYRDGPVTAHRVRGAIAAYLLISFVFAKAYALINYLVPGAFTISPALTEFRAENEPSFYYFSVVTLTTVGFGDITPVAPLARSLVMVEALIGQLYPAILLARLVSLSVAARPKE